MHVLFHEFAKVYDLPSLTWSFQPQICFKEVCFMFLKIGQLQLKIDSLIVFDKVMIDLSTVGKFGER